MTQQHFVIMAAILRDLRRLTPDEATLNWLDLVVVPRFCEECRRRNPKFRAEVFMKAAGYALTTPSR